MADQEAQSPTLQELPKVQSDLKSQLEQFDTQSLKNIEPQEKVVLPTAEGNSSFSSIELLNNSLDRPSSCFVEGSRNA